MNMRNLLGDNIISLITIIIAIGFLSVLISIFLCPFTQTMLGDSKMPFDHAANFVGMTSFTLPNIFISLIISILLSIIFATISNFRNKLYAILPTPLVLNNFFVRKRLDFAYIIHKIFYSWYSLFEHSPNAFIAT